MEFLVREVADIRQVLESMNWSITGPGLEEKGGEVRDRVAVLGEAAEKRKCEGFLK